MAGPITLLNIVGRKRPALVDPVHMILGRIFIVLLSPQSGQDTIWDFLLVIFLILLKNCEAKKVS